MACHVLSLAASFIFVGKSFSTWVLLLVKETLISSCLGRDLKSTSPPGSTKWAEPGVFRKVVIRTICTDASARQGEKKKTNSTFAQPAGPCWQTGYGTLWLFAWHRRGSARPKFCIKASCLYNIWCNSLWLNPACHGICSVH